jgi:Fe-S oxidoreductase
MAATEKLPVKKGLKGAEDEILTCTLCGYCKESCPFFNSLGWDSNTSRGRILLSYALLHNVIPPDEKAVETIYKCTLCGKLLPAHKAVLKQVEESGNIFGDKTPTTEMHNENVHKSPVAYFAGCVSSYSARKPAAATRKLLKRMGIEFTMIDEFCCGAPHHLVGAGMEKCARENIERLKKQGVRTVIFSCDGCYKMFKEVYPKVVKSDLQIKHIAEVIAENIDKLPEPKVKETVTYHDSCDLGRHMKMYDLPRKVLSRFANIKEMPATREKALCCGTGGGARIAFGDTSDAIALKRLNMAEGVAPVLVTTCPACSHSMEIVAKKGKKKVQPLTLAQFIEETIERIEKK